MTSVTSIRKVEKPPSWVPSSVSPAYTLAMWLAPWNSRYCRIPAWGSGSARQ